VSWARSHGATDVHGRRTGAARALKRRLRRLRREFEDAYHELAARAAASAAPSYASEWFLDNYHLVRSEVDEVARDLPPSFHRQLPRLANPSDPAFAGLPRVQALAVELVEASSCRPATEDLVTAIARYQEVAPLRIGELWAVPAMLRFVLLDRLAEAIAAERSAREPATRVRPAPDETVESCISSLRRIDAEDWMEFFERLSVVEAALRADPSGVYPRMAFETRDRYRKEVERIARGCPVSEVDVADHAVSLAGAADEAPLDHVGYYLIGAGVGQLEGRVGCGVATSTRAARLVRGLPTVVYLLPILLLATLLLAGLSRLAAGVDSSPAALLGLLLVGVVPALTIAVATVNIVVTQLIRPRVLPRLDLDDGVPANARSLVVMPVLLTDTGEVNELLERLERHYLTDPDPRIGYALLTDFADAPAHRMPRDRELLDAARDGIESLNRRYGVSSDAGPFHLLHRERRWSTSERCWMGWERKRGKLEELNRLLAGATDTSYTERVGATDFLQDIRFVITLDADTRIARDGARELIAIASHPLNRPRHDHTGRVVAGHGILQPRLEILPEMANRSRFARLFSGDTGLDPYTLAVSDTYQDLFGEGIYVGKGLYDVDAFRRSLDGRIPPSTLLSHDLIEGLFARPALVTDVVFFEDYPTHQLAQLLRAQRWIRGDWQLLPWLVRPASAGLDELPPMKSVIGRWKILDNLRRSLLAPALVALLTLGWLALPVPLLWTGLALLTLAMPVLMGLAIGFVRMPMEKSRTLGRELGGALTRFTLAAAFLPVEAAMALHSIGVTLWRVYVSRRHLLQWTTAADVDRRSDRAASLVRAPAYRIAAAFTLVLAGATSAAGGGRFQAASPLLILWLFSPVLSRFLHNPAIPRMVPLDRADRDRLRLLARRTWLFFEAFVGPADRWLPPDNVQNTDAGPRIAHRTSPTNIGLLLSSTFAAYELGYIGVLEMAVRLRQTLDSVDELERYRGHLYNWYDTRHLTPLPPRYVSTVDSGNLAACLVVVAQGCRDSPHRPAPAPLAWTGFIDALNALERGLQAGARPGATARSRRKLAALRASAEAVGDRGHDWAGALDAIEPAWRDLQRSLLDMIRTEDAGFDPDDLDEVRTWAERSRHHLRTVHREIRLLAPWIEAVRSAPRGPAAGGGQHGVAAAWAEFVAALPGAVALREVPGAVWRVRERLATLRRRLARDGDGGSSLAKWCEDLDGALTEAERTARDTSATLAALAERADALVAAMDFALLYDRRRRLFHIGYQVDMETPDPGHYDLLASEARVASLLAVAKHEAPVDHWRQLGRPFAVRGGRRVLLSWSGTMFEYLMPRLFLRSYHGTLLDQSCASAVEIQRRYGSERNRPWGLSESAYNRLDATGTYQYKAFGVPGLGLKRGLAEDMVVAPYASVLALAYAPRAAIANLDALDGDGALGRYGFYDAVDYTPARLPLGSPHAVVRTFMAHHKGMSLAALCNLLRDEAIVERFHADPRVRTVEPLLQERLPTRAIQDHGSATDPIAPAARPQRAATAWKVDPAAPTPPVHYLANGRYGVLITAAGGGQSRWNGTALTRWRSDATLEEFGFWVYVRDAENRRPWSIGRAPIGDPVSDEQVLFFPHKAELRRRVGDTIAAMEVITSPVDDVEIRRVTLTNASDSPRTLRVTSYAEVALTEHSADLRHPAFQKLFVEARALPDGEGLVYRRRQRGADEPTTPCLAHGVVFEDGEPRRLHLCADREAFLGRGRDAGDPAALDGHPPVSRTGGREGVVDPRASLDPILSIGVDVGVPAHSSVRLAYVTAAGPDLDVTVDVLHRYGTWSRVDAAIDQARVQSEQEMRRHDLTSETIAEYQELLSLALFRDPALGPPADAVIANRWDRTGLWAHGISGDHPIVLVRVDDPEQLGLVQSVLGAHAYWRRRSLRIDLVILDERGSGYDLEVQNKLDRLLMRRGDDVHLGAAGGLYVLRAAMLSEGDLTHLTSRASVLLDGRAGALRAQLPAPSEGARGLPDFAPPGAASVGPQARGSAAAGAPAVRPAEQLAFPTPWGGFTPDGREFAIDVGGPEGRPPVPWCNVVANEEFGFLASESALGCTWAVNSGEHRLTPWTNDPVTDPPAEVVYLRDEETARIWSATPNPAGAGAAYRVRHGAGYTSYAHERHGLSQELTAFVDATAALKYLVLRIHDLSGRQRRLTATYYVPWVLGTTRDESRSWIVPSYEAETRAVFARSAFDATFADRVAFVASASRPLHGLTTDRTEFLGRLGSRARPEGLLRIGLSGTVRPGPDPCAAIQVHVDLEPGGVEEVVFVLGEGADREEALDLLRAARAPGSADSARRESEKAWESVLGVVTVQTPDPGFDVLLNRWLPYQVLACRLWARSGFYQSSGAYGFRDQLQDVMALCHARPDLARAHILRSAAHQFVDGDVLHWWHRPSGKGVRTRISDDLLWLPFVTSHYVRTTGDAAILDEVAPFLSGPMLEPGIESLYAHWEGSRESATLFEHCRRAIERGSTSGVHGLPLIGAGDWNDGMNRVGVEGRGESVWLGWFLHEVLRRFAELSRARGLERDAARYEERAATLAVALEEAGWDGAWYRRAYYDDGTPLGTAQARECRIDAIAQSWSVLSGVASPERSARAMASLREHLVREDARLSLLLAPPFDDTPRDPGYIKGYRPGVRENGGQYTHAAAWTAWALAERGDAEGAYRLFGHCSPLRHTETPERARNYRAEPYVTAGDIYGAKPWLGRAGWSWYTGSAAWVYRLGLERILGFQRAGDTLRLDPRMPSSWPGFRIEYRYGASTYVISVRRASETPGRTPATTPADPGAATPAVPAAAVPSVTLDGAELADRVVALVDDGKEHSVEVVLEVAGVPALEEAPGGDAGPIRSADAPDA